MRLPQWQQTQPQRFLDFDFYERIILHKCNWYQVYQSAFVQSPVCPNRSLLGKRFQVWCICSSCREECHLSDQRAGSKCKNPSCFSQRRIEIVRGAPHIGFSEEFGILFQPARPPPQEPGGIGTPQTKQIITFFHIRPFWAFYFVHEFFLQVLNLVVNNLWDNTPY